MRTVAGVGAVDALGLDETLFLRCPRRYLRRLAPRGPEAPLDGLVVGHL